jgi:hypothetical protein
VAQSSESLLRELYQNLLATKPREWEYEQEIRLIVHGLEDEHQRGVRVSFPPEAVKALYIGDRVRLRDKSRIMSAGKNAVKTWTATRRLDSYGITHGLLWDPDLT